MNRKATQQKLKMTEPQEPQGRFIRSQAHGRPHPPQTRDQLGQIPGNGTNRSLVGPRSMRTHLRAMPAHNSTKKLNARAAKTRFPASAFPFLTAALDDV